MVIPTIWPPQNIVIRRFPTETKGIRVRWVHFRRTGMGYMTWGGMYLSGVGIGMQRRMPEGPIHAGLSGCNTAVCCAAAVLADRKSTRLNSSHLGISYAV